MIKVLPKMNLSKTLAHCGVNNAAINRAVRENIIPKPIGGMYDTVKLDKNMGKIKLCHWQPGQYARHLAEAAKHANIGTKTIQRWMKKGFLKYQLDGSFIKEDIDKAKAMAAGIKTRAMAAEINKSFAEEIFKRAARRLGADTEMAERLLKEVRGMKPDTIKTTTLSTKGTNDVTENDKNQ